MNNKTILIISSIITLIGIISLLIIMQTIQPIKTKINQLDDSKINQKIQLEVQILSIKTYPTFQILRVNDSTGKIDVILDKNNILLTQNQKISIIGKINEYKTNLQIQAEKINLIS